MISALYNGYLIVSVGIEDASTHHWGLTLDIIGRQPGSRSHSIYTPYEFQTKEEAEQHGLEEAKAWIKRQSQTTAHPAVHGTAGILRR